MYKGKKVLVVGAGRSGIAMAKYFVREGAIVTITDKKSKEELGAVVDQIADLNCEWDFKGHSLKAVSNAELIAVSPGANHREKAFEPARQKGVPFIGELELASQHISDPIIAITGTNGKSTVTKLTYEFLKASGVKAWIGGNFGTPLMEYVLSGEKGHALVCEVSSFQLELVDTFRPRAIVFLNLAEDHMDRYSTFQDYINAKKNIFKNSSPETIAILNADEPAVIELAKDANVRKNKLQYFSRRSAMEAQISKIGGAVMVGREVHLYWDGQMENYNLRKTKMKGKAVAENIMAAAAAARRFGAKPDAIQSVIDTFPGLEHRLEYVRTKGGADFYNDSKATNVHALMHALQSFENSVILIAGGRDKNTDFAPLADLIHEKVKNLILIGEAKEKLNRTIGDYSETFIIGTFDEAVLLAYQKSRGGDTILLSPGCSSYDMFKNYEERGKYFKELINKI